MENKQSAKLVRSGLILSVPYFIDKYSRFALNKKINQFKINTIDFNGDIKHHRTFINVPHRKEIIFARMYGLKVFSQIPIQNCISSGLEMSKKIWSCKFKLLPHQTTALKYMMNNIYNEEKIKSGHSSCIFNMKAGLGKTYLAMKLINILQQKTLIIVPTSFLLAQWIKVISENMPDIAIGTYSAKKKMDGDIIIMVCNSALSEKFTFSPQKTRKKVIMTPIIYFKQFGLVIYDEIHKYCSPVLRKIFIKAQAKCVLGISATTDNRLDKLDVISHHYLGPVIYADEICNYESNIFKMHVTVLKYYGPKEYTKKIISGTGHISHPLMINQICDDPYRKILLCNELEKIYHSGANAFIFADRREYLKELAYTLYKRVQNKNKQKCCLKIPELHILLGGSGIDDIEQAKAIGQMIFSTYAYLDTGVSIERMTHLVIATPRRNGWEQIVGRICRLSGDKNITREILLISDGYTSLARQITYASNHIKKIFNAKCDIISCNFEDLKK